MQGGEFRCESSLLFSLIGLAMLALHFAACIAGHTKVILPAGQFFLRLSTSVNSKGEWSELEYTPMIDARSAKGGMFHYFGVPTFALKGLFQIIHLWQIWISQSVVAPIAFKLWTILLQVARYSWPLRSWVMGVRVDHSVGVALFLESCLAPFACTLEWS